MTNLRSLIAASVGIVTVSMLIVAPSMAGSAGPRASAPRALTVTTKFSGPVVLIKDRRGFVGAIFKLSKTLPHNSNGSSQGLVLLNHVVNDRHIGHYKGRCYYSIFNDPSPWGQEGHSYEARLQTGFQPDIHKLGHLYRASSGYKINESNGLFHDPHVTRRVHC